MNEMQVFNWCKDNWEVLQILLGIIGVIVQYFYARDYGMGSATKPKILVGLSTYEEKKKQKHNQMLAFVMIYLFMMMVGTMIAMLNSSQDGIVQGLSALIFLILLACLFIVVVLSLVPPVRIFFEKKLQRAIVFSIPVFWFTFGMQIDWRKIPQNEYWCYLILSIIFAFFCVFILLQIDSSFLNKEFEPTYKTANKENQEFYIFYLDNCGKYVCGKEFDLKKNQTFIRIDEKDVTVVQEIDEMEIEYEKYRKRKIERLQRRIDILNKVIKRIEDKIARLK